MEFGSLQDDKVIRALMSVLNAELTRELNNAGETDYFAFEDVTSAIGFDPPELQASSRTRITAIITAVLSVVMGNSDFQIRSIRMIRGEKNL